jgi:hypothetical protein
MTAELIHDPTILGHVPSWDARNLLRSPYAKAECLRAFQEGVKGERNPHTDGTLLSFMHEIGATNERQRKRVKELAAEVDRLTNPVAMEANDE